MQIVLHAGAHETDDDLLVRCLSDNRDLLRQNGIAAPPPNTYRKLIRDLLHEVQQGKPTDGMRETLLDRTATDSATQRLVLSNPGFFGTPKMAASGGILYSAAEERLAVLDRIFARDTLEFHLAIRNPATFLSAIFRQTPLNGFEELMRGARPQDVRWSEMIERIRTAFPDLPITVWCNEDTPLIWSEVVRELAGLDPMTCFEGEFLLLSKIMSKPGMQRFHAYLDRHPGMTEVQKRRVIEAFLEKFAEQDKIEEELDLPGWTEELIDQMTELYDEDVYAIQRLPCVNLITP